MNISELSTELRELSDDYSCQRIVIDEYRTKRKSLLDEIDQILNNQTYENFLRNAEKKEESDGEHNIMPEAINTVFAADKESDGDGT